MTLKSYKPYSLTASLILLAVLMTACDHTTKKDIDTNTDDVLFAQRLWTKMKKEHLVGEQSIPLKPFFGGAKPHGMILEVYNHQLMMGEHNGFLVLKRNYNGHDVSVKNVKKNRRKYLSSITIMYQREAGYDADNLNLFWAKYKPDGKLFIKDLADRKMPLAGRLIKGETYESNRACLYCHASAGGGDYIFYPDIKLPGFQYVEE